MPGASEGAVIAGRYELVRLIGEGGMARIWRAHDFTLARDVALKFLFLREGRDGKTMLDRFLREARIAASVRHPNVVDILDFGTTNDGRPFMVMELLAGTPLEERMQGEPRLTLDELVGIAAGVLDGLAAVHKAGIVHRDLKPDNIFLLEDGEGVRPKLLDFGVSREADPHSGKRSTSKSTNDGYLVGTPEYMSPEQARGLADVDWRTDIYSMGVVLYEGLTGHLPYLADAVGDLIIEIVGGGAADVAVLRPDVGPELSAVIKRAMAAEREDRYQSAREMRNALLKAASEHVRASFPVAVPMQRAVITGRHAVSADAGTLDEVELPWGPGAVPELKREAGTPPSWEVDEKPEEARPRRRAWPFLVVAAAIPLTAALTWLVVHEARPTARRVARPSTFVQAVPEPVAAPEPSTPVASTVRVELRGLRATALVEVNGQRVLPQNDAIQLPRDGAAHQLVVRLRGHRPWSTTHRADADGVYQVSLERVARASQGETAASGVIRELDY